MQAPAVLDLLTESEKRVVLLVAEGLTNPQIATRLFVSPQTVKTHMKNVFRKLGVSSRTELTVLVVREDPQGA
jgi:DNA-binding NarL/FixJ family response regulator